MTSADGATDVVLGSRPLTVLEAVARRTRVPHPVVVLVVALLLGSPILPYVAPDRETTLFTSVYLPHLGQIHGWLDVVYQSLVIVSLVFSPLATSFMLDRLWRTPSEAPWLRDAIDSEVLATAASSCRVLPPLVLGIATMSPMLVQYLGAGHVADIPQALVALLETAIVVARFGLLFMFVWCHIRCQIGLSRMSATPLGLLPSNRDRWLGTRPLGSLALALTMVYSTGLALALSIVASGPAGTAMVPVVIGLFLLGLLLFFLPLRSVHRQMAAEKAHEQMWLRERLASVVVVSRHQSDPEPGDPLAGLRDTFAVEIAGRHVNEIRTWPIDTSIAAKLLTTIALPLSLTLIGRQLVLVLLGV